MNQSHGASLFKRESPFSAWPSSKGGGSSPGWSPPVNRSSPATMRATLLPGRTSASGAGSCPITVPGWLSDGRRATRPARKRLLSSSSADCSTVRPVRSGTLTVAGSGGGSSAMNLKSSALMWPQGPEALSTMRILPVFPAWGARSHLTLRIVSLSRPVAW